MNIDQLVADHGLGKALFTTPLRRDALACVSLPTCGLAMAEAERYLPTFVDRVEELLVKHGPQGDSADAAHHRLPERLRAAVSRRDRAHRPRSGPLHAAPRRATPSAQRLNVIYRDNIDEAPSSPRSMSSSARYAPSATPTSASAISCGA